MRLIDFEVRCTAEAPGVQSDAISAHVRSPKVSTFDVRVIGIASPKDSLAEIGI
tara:strand:- start:198 stop:359 length:162 start_codon:yes stop_codon:yes gene_type:complete